MKLLKYHISLEKQVLFTFWLCHHFAIGRPVSSVIKNIAVGAEGLRFDFQALELDTVSPMACH